MQYLSAIFGFIFLEVPPTGTAAVVVFIVRRKHARSRRVRRHNARAEGRIIRARVRAYTGKDEVNKMHLEQAQNVQ